MGKMSFVLLGMLIAAGLLFACVQEPAPVKETDLPDPSGYMTPELRKEVERLKADIAVRPTDADNLMERAGNPQIGSLRQIRVEEVMAPFAKKHSRSDSVAL